MSRPVAPPPAPPRARGYVRLAVAGAVVAISLVATVVLHLRYPDALVTMLPNPDMRDLHVDFDTFWQSAAALGQGTDIYATPAKLHNLNPPLLSVLLLPLTALDVLTAYRVFVGLTLLMVVGAVLAAARELRLPAGVTALVTLAVLVSSPLHGTLVLGQIYPLLLVGLVAGWIAERRGHPVLAAVCYGVTVAIKPSLAPLLILPAVQRRWVPMRAGIAAAAGASLVGVAVAGPSAAIEWLRIALTEGVADTVDNASFPGLAMRFDVPVVGLVLGLALLVGTLWWIGRHRDRIDPGGTAPFAVVAAALLFAPIAWHNYLMLLVPGVLLLITQRRGATAAALLAVAIVPVSWNAIWPPEPSLTADLGRSLYWVILMAYWFLLLSAAPRPSSPGSSSRSRQDGADERGSSAAAAGASSG